MEDAGNMLDTLVDSIGVEFVLVLPVRVTQFEFSGPPQQPGGVPFGLHGLIYLFTK